MKLGTQLKIAFVIVLLIPFTLATIYTVLYYSNKIRQEALQKISSDLKVASLVYKNKIEAVKDIALNYTHEKHLSMLFDFKLNERLKKELNEYLPNDGLYLTIVIDSSRRIVVRSADYEQSWDISLSNAFVEASLAGKSIAGTELISFKDAENKGVKNGKNKKLPQILSLTASSPIYALNGKEVAGAFIVRRILNLDKSIVGEIHQILNTDISIFERQGFLIASNTIEKDNEALSSSILKTIFEQGMPFEEAIFERGGYLAKYQPVPGIDGKPVGVLMLKSGADTYVETRSTAVTNLILIMLTGGILAIIVGFIFSRRIVGDIEKLTTGTNAIANGDYFHELRITRQDEIGQLAYDFNQMSKNLKKHTDHLEELVAERTKELKEAKNKAEAANRAKSDFLSNMSHELRTPLNAVTGFSELLSSMVFNKKQKSYLDAIKTAGKSLLILINDILDLSKIEAGKLEIQYASVNPRMIFKEIEMIFKMKITGKNLEFIIDIDKDLPSALVLDETRLRQILLNLMGNAVKFTEKGYIRLSAKKIYKVSDRSKVDLIISVEDTGIGISEKEQESIFISFQQQDGQSIKKFGGTGLGLAISKKLTEIMSGRISVRSKVGEGSIFEITLRDVDVSLSEVSSVEEAFDVNDISFDKAKVLVVDDVESNVNLLRELLSNVNLDVLTAGNGQEAIIMAGEYQPDVIIMDIRMPVMDGIEATKRLKGSPNTKEIPIIALTASSKPDSKTEMLKFGLDGYLTKPVRLNCLFEELCRYLKHTKKAHPAKESSEYNKIVKNLRSENIENVSELAEILQNEIIPYAEKLKGAVKMGDIRKFTERIKQLGKDHNVQVLTSYSDRLREFEENFDIANIKKSLAEFYNITKDLTK
ncbi:ATP-binding protein [Desulfococcaceae bacterium HSG8]|nr:ATP-binding protein [Desulfococcaceae bacterium HSG8]